MPNLNEDPLWKEIARQHQTELNDKIDRKKKRGQKRIEAKHPGDGDEPEPPPGQEGDPGASEPLTGVVIDMPWTEMLHRNDKGAAYCNLANALIALHYAPEYRGVFCFDTMRQIICYDSKRDGTRDGIRLKTDADVFAVQNWLQHCGMTSMARQTCFDATYAVAHERPFNACRDYVENLAWDGESRVGNWLTSYLGVKGGTYTDAIGKMFLISMIARIMKPGCKCDYTLVLEGEQGLLKSAACSVLAGEYFSENMPDISVGKDAAIHVMGKWLVEIGELSAVLRAEGPVLKAFLTRCYERYRPPFERSEVIEGRTCVFIGTTNESAYLRDPTGGRRFWPVRVGEIHLDKLTRDRDQLFAEAAELYRKGEHWWPTTAFEKKHIKPEQELRRAADVWEASIETYIKGKHYVTLTDVALDVFGISQKDFGTASQRRIRDALELLRWEKDKAKDAQNRARWRAPGVLPL